MPNPCVINRNMKIKGNLSKEQPKTLKKKRQLNNNTKIYPFDKEPGFLVLSEGDAIKKTEEQLRKAKVIDEDPTKVS